MFSSDSSDSHELLHHVSVSQCYVKEGRQAFFVAGGLARLVPLLKSNSERVRARSVGVLHNVSSLPQSIRAIRELQAIDTVVRLLK